MTTNEPQPVLLEAANRFLLSLEASQSNEASLTINSFVHWCGAQRKPSSLTPSEIARFSQQLPPTDTEITQKTETLRAFLLYINKCKWTKIRLASHLKPRRSKSSRISRASRRPEPETVYLTPEGYTSLTEELETLKEKRPEIIKAVQLAAADKDFKENSPLAAAKEELGHVEGRISELEETIKIAKITGQTERDLQQVSIGDRVSLKNTATKETLCYTIVTTREANPFNEKISDSSPLGKALMGKSVGEVVESYAPAGKICYTIEKISNPSK